MAKRLTDTDKWKKPFIKGLETVYKLLWLYITDDCDHAGIWQVELDVAAVRIGEDLDEKKALEQFGDHVVPFADGRKWFLPDFVMFQYGELNESVKAHKSVLDRLKQNDLHDKIKPFANPLQRVLDKDKDKDKDKKGEYEGEFPFTKFWDLYDKKVGDKAKCEKKWNKLKKEEQEKIMAILPKWLTQFPDKQFQPYPATFMNGRRWEDEIQIKHGTKNSKPDEPTADFDNYDAYASVKEAVGAAEN